MNKQHETAKEYIKNGGNPKNLPEAVRAAIQIQVPEHLTDEDKHEIDEMLTEEPEEVNAKEVKKTMSTELPEAPMSISTTAYYKGFSIMITKRDPEVKVLPLLESQIKMIDFLIEKGFKPSWNEETNNAHMGNGQARRPVATNRPNNANQANCQHLHQADKQSTGHNKPENKGRWYISCQDCNKFIGWKDDNNVVREPVDF